MLQTTYIKVDWSHVSNQKSGLTYLALKKKWYWMRTVIEKKMTPSMAIAKRFFPTMSQARGERNRFSPDKTQTENFECLVKTSLNVFMIVVERGSLRSRLCLPNLSKASAIAWFFTISISPLPRQKWGKMRKTFFRMSLMPPISWNNREVTF